MAAVRRIVGLAVALAALLAALFLVFIGAANHDPEVPSDGWGGVLPAAVQGCMLLASVGLVGFLFARD